MECAEAARLLGIAWVGAGLYPDPASQDAFRRVAVELAELTDAIDFEPGPDELRCRREPLADLGPALRRLTASAFAHQVSVIRLHPGFTPEHLATFLKLLALDPAALEGIGGLAAAVRARELVGIEVALQSALSDAGPGVAASSDSLAVSMLLAALGETLPSVGSASYVEQFTEVVDSQPEQIAAYLEAFTRLEVPMQEAIISRLMGESARELQELFLNQLAGHELAALGATLGPQAASFLADYVEYSTGHRGIEAEAAVLDPSSLLTFRTEVAARVNSRLQELDFTGFVRGLEMPPKTEWADAAQETLRGLFLVEDRPDKRERAARAWTRLVSASVRRGSFAEAVGWYETGSALRSTDPGTWEAEHTRLAGSVIPTVALAAAGGLDPARLLLDGLGPADPLAVVTALESEEFDGKREPIVAGVARWLGDDVDVVLRALPSLERAVPAFLAMLKRLRVEVGSDERVRAFLGDHRPEVRLAALDVCGGSMSVRDLAAFLDDPAGQVRRHVHRALAQDASPEAIGALAHALAGASEEERLTIASALAKSTGGVAYLRSLAKGWRASLTATGRANRDLVAKVLR